MLKEEKLKWIQNYLYNTKMNMDIQYPFLLDDKKVNEIISYVNGLDKNIDDIKKIVDDILQKIKQEGEILKQFKSMIEENISFKKIKQPNMDLYMVNANPLQGFNFPYLLYVPQKTNIVSTICIDNKTPVSSKDEFDKTIIRTFEEDLEMSRIPRTILSEMNEPVFIPVLPRFHGFYTTALGSMIRNNDQSYLLENISNHEISLDEKDLSKLENIPEQYHQMILHAQNFIRNQLGLKVNSKVIQTGYSAASKLASNYTELYPETVEALIVGGTTGLDIRPTKKYNYPLGVKDIPNYDELSSKQVSRFIYIGREDENDPALCKCVLDDRQDVNGNIVPKLNENGNIMPIKDENGKYVSYYKDTYTDEEVNTIFTEFGQNKEERLENYREITQKLGYDVTIKMYEGNHKTVQRNYEVIQDVMTFLKLKTISKKDAWNRLEELINQSNELEYQGRVR